MNVIEITVNSIAGSREGFDSAAEGGSRMGKSISAGMVVAATAIAGVGLAVAKMSDQLFKAMDIEAANDKLAAQLGLGAESSAYYGQLAGSLYSQAYGESLDEVNEALRYTSQNIGDMVGESEGAFENATKAGMDFAAVFDEDISQASRAAGIMIKNGLAKDAQEAFDILTVGAQNGANAGDDLLDTYSEYSPLFAKLGLSGQQSLGMISQSMKAGARDSDFAADAIKEFSIRAIDGSKSSSEAFEALGLNADKMRATFAKGGPESAAAMDVVMDKLRAMKDPAKQAEVAVALFGTKSEDLAKTLSAMDPSTAVASLGQVEGAAKRMGDTMADNAKTKLESWKRSLETYVSNFIGQTVLPAVVSLATQAGPALDAFRSSAEGAFDWVEGKPEALGAIAAVVGTVLVAAFGSLAVAAWGAAAGVIAATWPILAIGAAVGGLAAILVAAYNNWDTFRSVVDTVVQFLQSNAAPAFEIIKNAVLQFYETALLPMVTYIQANSESFANIGKILLVVAGIIVGVLLVAFVASVAAMVALTAAGAVVVVGLVALIAVIYDVIQTLWNWFNNARDVAGGVVDNIENVIQVFWDMANNVGTAVANVVRAIWMVIQVGWDLAQNLGSAIADGVRWVYNLANAANNMANEIGAAVGRAVGWFFGLPGRIAGAVGDLGGVLVNAGRSIIDGLIRGIDSAFGALRSKLGQVTSLIPSWKGPKAKDEKLLEPTGGWIMGGLIRGVQRKVPDLRGVLGAVTAAIPQAVGAGAPVAGGGAAGAVAQTVHNWYVQGSIRSDRDLIRLVRDAANDLQFSPPAPAGGG